VIAALAQHASDSVRCALTTPEDVSLAWNLAHSLGLSSDHTWSELAKAYQKVEPIAVLTSTSNSSRTSSSRPAPRTAAGVGPRRGCPEMPECLADVASVCGSRVRANGQRDRFFAWWMRTSNLALVVPVHPARPPVVCESGPGQ